MTVKTEKILVPWWLGVVGPVVPVAAGNLTWTLGATTTYTAGEKLEFEITITNPADVEKTFYLLGGLIRGQRTIPRSVFFLLWDEGKKKFVSSYPVDGSVELSTITLAAKKSYTAGCEVTLIETNASFVLFCVEMIGEKPDPPRDKPVGSARTELTPAPPAPPAPDLTRMLGMLLPLLMIGLVIGMIIPMIKEIKVK